MIQVAETLGSRQEFIRVLLLAAVQRDLLLLLVAGGMLALVLFMTLRPLTALRNAVSARSDHDMTPIDTSSVPADVRPLVAAINLHMARNREFMEGRRRFVDDASHQLRTPLATLRTQLDYALRESDPRNVSDALDAVSRQLDDATHRTNQMLALAKADAAELEMGGWTWGSWPNRLHATWCWPHARSASTWPTASRSARSSCAAMPAC